MSQAFRCDALDTPQAYIWNKKNFPKNWAVEIKGLGPNSPFWVPGDPLGAWYQAKKCGDHMFFLSTYIYGDKISSMGAGYIIIRSLFSCSSCFMLLVNKRSHTFMRAVTVCQIGRVHKYRNILSFRTLCTSKTRRSRDICTVMWCGRIYMCCRKCQRSQFYKQSDVSGYSFTVQ